MVKAQAAQGRGKKVLPMTQRPYILAETNWRAVEATPFSVAMLPWGATEAHNYHLPYGTDSFQSESIAAEAARIAWEAGTRAIVLPTVPFGVQTGQLDIPLCLNMNPSTQASLLKDLAHALSGQGIGKLVILNGHGGNDFKSIIRELQPTAGLFLCVVNWYKIVDPAPYFAEPGDHAGEIETSLMQHIAPHLVRPLSEAGDGAERKIHIPAFREGWAWTPRHWRSASADTGVGNPAASTPEKGRRYHEAVCAKLATLLIDLAKADVEDLYDGVTQRSIPRQP